MMEAVKHYLLAVTAAGLLCGIAGAMLGEKSAVGRIGRTVTGAVLALVMLGPLTGLRLGSLPDRIGTLRRPARPRRRKAAGRQPPRRRRY